MRCVERVLLITIVCLAATAPLAALSDSDLERNRQLLEKARSDPAHYARLCQGLAAFQALPAERQERLRRLVGDLHKEPPAARARLSLALERYAGWLERLPELERRQIESSPDNEARLKLIKQIRQRQWTERLPKTYRERLARAPAPERPALSADWRQQENWRREEWRVAFLHWDELLRSSSAPPARPANFPLAVQAFVNDWLAPLLTPAELERLRTAEGQWPLYPMTLVELADTHPIFLPGPANGPSRFKDLPPDVATQLNQLEAGLRRLLHDSEGKWPDFALAVTATAKAKGIALPRPLGPSGPKSFGPPIRQFIANRLDPVLSREEKERLQAADGQWPLYPRTVLQLAAQHGLQVPGRGTKVSLPSSRDFWDRYRTRQESGIRRQESGLRPLIPDS